jgi:hypothetical protein
MTAKQSDAHERWRKGVFFCFAVLLMLDLVYLGVARPSGAAKIACWLIAAALGYACIHAMRQLDDGGFREKGPVDLSGEPYNSPVSTMLDLTDSSSDNDL